MEENKNIQNEQAAENNEAPATEACAKCGFFANKKNIYIVAAIAAVAIVAGIVLAVVLGGNNAPVNGDDNNGGDIADEGNGGEEIDEKLIAPDVDKNTLGYVFFEKFVELKKADATKSAETILNEMLETNLSSAVQFPDVQPAKPGYLSGFSGEFSGFESGAFLTPGMMGVAFIAYAFDLAEDANVADFIKSVEENADPAWNMCTTAETVTIGAYDKSVFFIMCPEKIPSKISGIADVLEPNVEDGSASADVWTEFKAIMSGENAPEFAVDIANAISGIFAGEVTEADWAIENDTFAYSVDGYASAAYITDGDKSVYVFCLDEGMEVQNWTDYYFDGINADDYSFGAYNTTIILMVNVG